MFSLVVAFKVFPRPFLIFRYWYDASKFLDAASCFSLDPPRMVLPGKQRKRKFFCLFEECTESSEPYNSTSLCAIRPHDSSTSHVRLVFVLFWWL